MRFKKGDLVRIVSSINSSVCYGPPAVIIRGYIGDPKILLYNEEENRKWVVDDGIHSREVYDIMYKGKIEEAVLGEWLEPLPYPRLA